MSSARIRKVTPQQGAGTSTAREEQPELLSSVAFGLDSGSTARSARVLLHPRSQPTDDHLFCVRSRWLLPRSLRCARGIVLWANEFFAKGLSQPTRVLNGYPHFRFHSTTVKQVPVRRRQHDTYISKQSTAACGTVTHSIPVLPRLPGSEESAEDEATESKDIPSLPALNRLKTLNQFGEGKYLIRRYYEWCPPHTACLGNVSLPRRRFVGDTKEARGGGACPVKYSCRRDGSLNNQRAPAHKNHCERGKMATPLTRNVEHSVDDIVAKHLRLWTDDPRAKSKKRGRRSRRPRHAVHFKESTLVQPIAPHDNEDKKRIWYDHEEREELKRRVRHDTKVLWRAVDLAESNGRNLSRSENFMYACLGMSSRISPAVALKIKQNQLQHVRRMTSAQDTLTHEQLALLSSRSSQSAQERAHRIAVHYSITLA